jgi:hypothetical protein
MAYYAYMAGFCRYCGEDLGLIDQAGGRMRQYCNNACKQNAYLRRRDGEKRQAIILRNGELSDCWADNGITGMVLSKLQDILVEHGKDAARAATDVVILARQLERDSGSAERTSLIEHVMSSGEACDFEALRLEDTHIAYGIDGWSSFCSTADNSLLRLVIAVMRQRQDAGRRR